MTFSVNFYYVISIVSNKNFITKIEVENIGEFRICPHPSPLPAYAKAPAGRPVGRGRCRLGEERIKNIY